MHCANWFDFMGHVSEHKQELRMMHDKTAVVTGSYSGIGREISRVLVAKGYGLVMINRDARKADEFSKVLMDEYPGASIDSYVADLAVHGDIRDVAAAIAKKHRSIDALFNNAGVLLGSKKMSKQGNELHFEVNTVAPFLLTKLLKPLLVNGRNAVVVTTGSGVRRMIKKLELESLRDPKIFKKMTGPYAQSKLAVSTAFAGLRSEYSRDNIRLMVVDLGPVQTAMSLSDGLPGWMRLFRPLFSSPQKAAKKLVDAAFQMPDPPTASRDDRDGLPDASVQKKLIDFLNDITQVSVPSGIKVAR